MRLSECTCFDNILIQCHDNPDADALASGYALYLYFQKLGKQVRFIYRGNRRITKRDLLIMVDELKIPILYEPEIADIPQLLITVDCQYGQRNVTATKAENIAVIDHHPISGVLPPLSEIRSHVGSASTIVWDMLCTEGFDLDKEPLLSTALYYGLYTDSNGLAGLKDPLDQTMVESLSVRPGIIQRMNHSNISLSELRLTGKAIQEYEYDESDHCLILKAEPCDPNILGVISDFSMGTEGVDVCVVYFVAPSEIKFSIRSCVREIPANDLALHIADQLGGGGGHLNKAGGTIRPDRIGADTMRELSSSVNRIFHERITDYFRTCRCH
ncbi:MAG: DHH family phosphoesterase [Lachnospiraceae bacterium]|nr:DHH family phosphoesterase [Lachnospiraceae bacterium]